MTYLYTTRHPDQYKIPKICPYCGSTVVLTSNSELHGVEHGSGKCYLCRNCRASVNTHNDLITPMGRMADSELKEKRIIAHSLFDPFWQTKYVCRKTAYARLAKKLDVPKRKCHIAWFDIDTLNRAIIILKEGL